MLLTERFFFSNVLIFYLSPLNHRAHSSGVCTQSPVFGIVMEFCPYGPLNQVLKEGTKVVTPKRVVMWSKQIANGMQYLHSHKILHRDLKSPK